MSSLNVLQGVRTSRSQQKRLGIIIRWIIAIILIAFAIFPVLWIISASLSPTGTLSTQTLIPENASLKNYETLFSEEAFPFKTWFWNSLKISTIATLLTVSITTFAAYSFSRFRFRNRQNILRGVLLVQVFPGILAIVAVFLLVAQIGRQIPALGLNTHGGLILVYLGGAMGINIWLMKGFFDSIPRAIDESAMVDGASHWQIFSRLLLPLMRPIIVVVAILTFIFVYGDFVTARILLSSPQQQTLMVGLYIFTSGLIGALPIVIVYIALQDQIVGGLTQGAVKG
jgi:ABC-type maltose transport system permease subunit